MTRTSQSYRFTTTDLNDPRIDVLRELKAVADLYHRRARKNKSFNTITTPFGYQYLEYTQPKARIRIRPRGPRGNNYYDTPMENATHYDVYYELSSTVDYETSQKYLK